MTQMAHSTAAALGDRLSKDASLKLPASLQSAAAGAVPDQHLVKQHLKNLLERDAGVFLERYGDKLSLEERSLFQALRADNYEVNFHLSALEAAERQHKPAGRSTAVTNRRWAALQRLEQGGEYFAEEAMRRRAPLLFQLYFGERPPGAPPGAGSSGGGKLSDLLLRQHDEALTRQRLAREQAREAEVEQEKESEDEEEAPAAAEGRQSDSEDEEEADGEGGSDSREGSGEGCWDAAAPGRGGRAEAAVSRPAGAAAATPSAARSLRAEGGDSRAAAPGSSPDAHRSGQHHGGDGSSGGGSDADNGRAGMGAAEGRYRVEGGTGHGGMGAQEGDEAGNNSGAGAGSGRAGGSATAAVDREDFLELMRGRFLAGLDEDVDYAAIDGDRSLDEDFRALAEQDELDRYFDGD